MADLDVITHKLRDRLTVTPPHPVPSNDIHQPTYALNEPHSARTLASVLRNKEAGAPLNSSVPGLQLPTEWSQETVTTRYNRARSPVLLSLFCFSYPKTDMEQMLSTGKSTIITQDLTTPHSGQNISSDPLTGLC